MNSSGQQRLAEQRAADQWKRQVLAQKNKMATLQALGDVARENRGSGATTTARGANPDAT